MSISNKIGLIGCTLLLLGIILCNVLFTFCIKWCWNWVMPLFWEGAPILTFWQTFGCIALITLISMVIKGCCNGKK